jgi:MoxR-like ATPase
MEFRLVDNIQPEFDPARYVVEEGLRQAAEVAFALRQPLLLMGEPGTGKTRFAQKLAWELAQKNGPFQFLEKPLVFHTKTSSAARDLFYTYDSLAHFQSANIRRSDEQGGPNTADFITLQALGKAIAQTRPQQVIHPELRKDLHEHPRSTVVLVDEIDKAPRDFPNDILNEIENQEFYIRELGNFHIQGDNHTPIMVIMTSNSEKNLPDAFLRRCVFYHIPFPDHDGLLKIARSALGKAGDQLGADQLDQLVKLFEDVRKKAARKAPGTAELLAWLRVVGMQQIQALDTEEKKRQMRDNLSILVKTREDYDAVKDVFQ